MIFHRMESGVEECSPLPGCVLDLIQRGELEQAEQSLALIEPDLPASEGRILRGMIFLFQGRWQESLPHFEQGLEFARTEQNIMARWRCCAFLSQVYRELDQAELAYQSLQLALHAALDAVELGLLNSLPAEILLERILLERNDMAREELIQNLRQLQASARSSWVQVRIECELARLHPEKTGTHAARALANRLQSNGDVFAAFRWAEEYAIHLLSSGNWLDGKKWVVLARKFSEKSGHLEQSCKLQRLVMRLRRALAMLNADPRWN